MDEKSRSSLERSPISPDVENNGKTLNETITTDESQIEDTKTREMQSPDVESKTDREETSSSGSKETNLREDVIETTDVGEGQMLEKTAGELLNEEEDFRKSISWSHPDFQTDWSDFEILAGHSSSDESDVKIGPVDSFFPGLKRDEEKVNINKSHGYTFTETTEVDVFGNRKSVRKFLPRIHQKTRTYRKSVPVKVTFTKLINDIELVEEEEDINEEMEVDEIVNTCLVKKKDINGEEVEEETEIIQESIKYPGKKRKFIKLRMINDVGETIEELVELNDDSKRTNEIMKLAIPYLKKKTQALSTADDGVSFAGYEKTASMAHPEWYKAKDSQKDLIKMKVIERLKVARDEQKVLKDMNKYLGKRLCEFYDLKGPKDPHFVYDERGNTEEEKQKYQKRLLEFNDVVNFIFNENKKRAEMISQAEKDTQRDVEELNKEKTNFYGLEEAMLKDIDVVEENKALRSMTFAELMNQQKAMDSSLAKVRLDFIRSQITLKDLQEKKAAHQSAIDNMEKVDFINFESLRFKTKDLNDKLDLKEKQVLTMKDRLTQRVQALAHVRLKSDHLTVENEKLRSETRDIEEELDALRKECLIVQIERRKLEKQLSKVTSKEGIEKYPYLVNEAPIVEAKGEEQLELLCQLVGTCTNLKNEMEEKLNKHKEGVEKHKQIQHSKKQKRKLYSLV